MVQRAKGPGFHPRHQANNLKLKGRHCGSRLSQQWGDRSRFKSAQRLNTGLTITNQPTTWQDGILTCITCL